MKTRKNAIYEIDTLIASLAPQPRFADIPLIDDIAGEVDHYIYAACGVDEREIEGVA